MEGGGGGQEGGEEGLQVAGVQGGVGQVAPLQGDHGAGGVRERGGEGESREEGEEGIGG